MASSNPLGLSHEQRQVFGEYIDRQQQKGRKELPMEELEIVLEVIKIALPVDQNLPKADTKGEAPTLWVHPDTSEHTMSVLREQGYNPQRGQGRIVRP